MLIGINKDFKDLTTANEEYEFSQYLNDTSLYFCVSWDNRQHSWIIRLFRLCRTDTKFIKKENNMDRQCKFFQRIVPYWKKIFHWGNATFDLLGLSFQWNEMTEIDYPSTLSETECILQQRKSRKLNSNRMICSSVINTF